MTKTKTINILSHRGLDSANKNKYPESSFESIRAYLKKGFGIEIDIRFCKDEIIISHDANLKRLCGIDRNISSMYYNEIQNIRYGSEKNGSIATLKDILKMVNLKNKRLCAIHFKGDIQNKYNLDLLIKYLRLHAKNLKSILLFDLLPESAKYLKSKIANINLCCSISNDADIKKYNKCVFKTLLSLSDAIKNKRLGLYNWCWLDEWQKNDTDSLLSDATFGLLRREGFHIAMITPELHEDHEDNKNKKRLFERIAELLKLYPDAICTNYPEEVLNIIKQKGGYKSK